MGQIWAFFYCESLLSHIHSAIDAIIKINTEKKVITIDMRTAAITIYNSVNKLTIIPGPYKNYH